MKTETEEDDLLGQELELVSGGAATVPSPAGH